MEQVKVTMLRSDGPCSLLEGPGIVISCRQQGSTTGQQQARAPPTDGMRCPSQHS